MYLVLTCQTRLIYQTINFKGGSYLLPGARCRCSLDIYSLLPTASFPRRTSFSTPILRFAAFLSSSQFQAMGALLTTRPIAFKDKLLWSLHPLHGLRAGGESTFIALHVCGTSTTKHFTGTPVQRLFLRRDFAVVDAGRWSRRVRIPVHCVSFYGFGADNAKLSG